MELDFTGKETFAARPQELWKALNDPDTLARCLPGCRSIREIGPDSYKVEMQLKVASVGGSFAGDISLSEKEEPLRCRITVSGAGSLGHGNGNAQFTLTALDSATSLLTYEGKGEVGGLVAGVGQRILNGVAKHLIRKFFTDLRQVLSTAAPVQDRAQS